MWIDHVSLLNGCGYCVEHHFAGLTRLLHDEARSSRIRVALESDVMQSDVFDAAQRSALAYAQALTREPSAVKVLQGCVAQMRRDGWDDGGILEINQVTAYFNYANRTVLGLGVSIDGDILGLSPGNSENPADWAHR